MTTTGSLDEAIVRDVIGRYAEAYEARDVDAMIDFFADDADVTLAPGTFYGKEAVKQYLAWDVEQSPGVTIRPFGVGLLVSNNVAVSERMIDATYEGIRYEYPVVTIYELDDAGKIKRMRAYYDKLALEQKIASQLPGLKGWVAKRMLDYLVAQGRKGLHPS